MGISQCLEELDAIENVTALWLDVTVQEEIDAAVAPVADSGLGLHAMSKVEAGERLLPGPPPQ